MSSVHFFISLCSPSSIYSSLLSFILSQLLSFLFYCAVFDKMYCSFFEGSIKFTCIHVCLLGKARVLWGSQNDSDWCFFLKLFLHQHSHVLYRFSQISFCSHSGSTLIHFNTFCSNFRCIMFIWVVKSSPFTVFLRLLCMKWSFIC